MYGEGWVMSVYTGRTDLVCSPQFFPPVIGEVGDPGRACVCCVWPRGPALRLPRLAACRALCASASGVMGWAGTERHLPANKRNCTRPAEAVAGLPADAPVYRPIIGVTHVPLFLIRVHSCLCCALMHVMFCNTV